jgi:hypothetical protein
MAVLISEIVTELVVAPAEGGAPAVPGAGRADDEAVEAIVRRATERVLEVLRREWER